MTVIVDRRKQERRAPGGGGGMREVRDRRRPRVTGDFAPLASTPRVPAVKVVVHVDGGARGNPGPAAAAAVISTPDGEVARRGRRADRHGHQQRRRVPRAAARARARAGARRRRGRGRQRLRADRPAGQRRLQGQAPRHEAAARAGDGGARAASSAGRSAPSRARRTRAPTRSSTRRSTPTPTAPTPSRCRAAVQPERPQRRHRLRDLPADRRPAGPPAPAHAGRARRAAVHHRPPVLRAVVQADPARAHARPRRAARRAPAGRRAAPAAARWRSSGCCSTTSTCSRRWARTASSSSATRSSRRRASSRCSSGDRVDLGPARHVPRATPSRRPGRTSTRRSARPPSCPRTRRRGWSALATLYRDHEDDPRRAWLYRVAERLVDHDEGDRALAPPPRADGRARDRQPPRDRRLARRAVPRRPRSTAASSRSCGTCASGSRGAKPDTGGIRRSRRRSTTRS